MKTSEFLKALKADTAAISGTVKNDFYTLPDNLLNYKADASRLEHPGMFCASQSL